jgi:hypothetical protein
MAYVRLSAFGPIQSRLQTPAREPHAPLRHEMERRIDDGGDLVVGAARDVGQKKRLGPFPPLGRLAGSSKKLLELGLFSPTQFDYVFFHKITHVERNI